MNKFYLFFLVIVVTLLTSCGAAKKTTSSVSVQQKLELQYAKYKGTKYKYGGIDKNGFDCSGLVQKIYKDAFNIPLPRTASEMAEIGKKISKNKLKSGDLVFFRPSRKYKHVGIYIGNNVFIHSSTSKGVIKSELDNPYWNKKYKYAKRILNTK